MRVCKAKSNTLLWGLRHRMMTIGTLCRPRLKDITPYRSRRCSLEARYSASKIIASEVRDSGPVFLGLNAPDGIA